MTKMEKFWVAFFAAGLVLLGVQLIGDVFFGMFWQRFCATCALLCFISLFCD